MQSNIAKFAVISPKAKFQNKAEFARKKNCIKIYRFYEAKYLTS